MLLLVDLMFFAANLTKLVHGAWLPLLIGIVAFTVMTTWDRGREIVTRQGKKPKGRCATSSTRFATVSRRWCGSPARQCSSTAEKRPRPWLCGPTSSTITCSTTRGDHVDRNPAGAPRHRYERITIDELGYKRDGLIHVTASYGYMEPAGYARHTGDARPLAHRGPDRCRKRALLSVKAGTNCAGDAPTMAPWRKRLFIATSWSRPTPRATSTCRSAAQ